MPTMMVHGQGPNTADKEKAFHGIFSINLKVQTSSFWQRGRPYHHFDLNAGSGYNDKADCDGSPIVFLRIARTMRLTNYTAYFVDRDETAIEKLSTRLNAEWNDQAGKCRLHNGDNREFPRAIPDLIRQSGGNPRQDLGSVVCDPNGTDLPWEGLGYVSRECPKIDLIINYNTVQWMRDRGAGYKPAGVFMKDHLDQLRKQHWLIQKPIPGDRYKRSIIVGRNFKIDKWTRRGLFDLNSPEGQEVLERSLSDREWNDHNPSLFDVC